MREIKFRAWDNEEKIMVNFSLSDIHNDGLVPLYVNKHGMDGYCDLQSITVLTMQYTGLKDKNGKEIYEGDVVLHKEWGYPNGKESIVEYSDGGFYPFADSEDNAPYPEQSESEIIGNIYENQELLKD